MKMIHFHASLNGLRIENLASLPLEEVITDIGTEGGPEYDPESTVWGDRLCDYAWDAATGYLDTWYTIEDSDEGPSA